MDGKPDSYYIKKVKSGDTKSFANLVDRHKTMVYNIAFRITKRHEDAEDIAQEAFVKAYRSLKNFKGQSKFSTWVYSIAYNTAISKVRKKQVPITEMDQARLSEEHQKSSFNQLNTLNKQEQKKFIKIALEKLQEDEALLLTLFYLNENSVDEIHEITGLTHSNIKVKMHRARKSLFRELNGMLKEELPILI